jgi:molecular chaperone GrpE (heat shock protein)
VWRILQAELKKTNEAKILNRKYLLNLTEAVLQHKALLKDAQKSKCDEQVNKHIRNNMENLMAALAKIGIKIINPENEMYSDDYVELFESIAQIPDKEITEPMIKEVVQPAVMFNGGLLKMGKAIIAIPTQSPGLISDSNNNHQPYKLKK